MIKSTHGGLTLIAFTLGLLCAVLVFTLVPQTAEHLHSLGQRALSLFSGGSSEADLQAESPPEFPPSTAAEPRRFTLMAAGDILLTRTIGKRITQFGWDYPLAKASGLIQAADLAFCNLESPISQRGTPYPGKPPVVTFRSDPVALFGVKKAGIDIVSLANNHMTDYGAVALEDTLQMLDLIGIRHAGAGRNQHEAEKPLFIDINGFSVALLARAEPIWSVVPASDTHGVATLDPQRLIQDVEAAALVSDIVLVSIHWGEEHQSMPRESDRKLAKALIDAGATAILGHHPHVLQGIEWYKGAPILYSLGNFVFDMAADITYKSGVVYLRFKEDASPELRFVPVQINRTMYSPAPLQGEAAQAAGKSFAALSKRLGTESELLQDGSVLFRWSGDVKKAESSSRP